MARVAHADAPTSEAPETLRVVGIHFGVPGTLLVDADYKRFHGFASLNVLAPILTASGDSAWIAGSVGAGMTWPLGDRWKLDLFAHAQPLRITSYYTHLAAGIGAGFHYTAPTGFSFGFTLPLLGFSTRTGSSPYGYDPPFTYNDSLGYYYLGSFVGLPLVTFGYRISTNCPI